jgi:hypothetical protein
MQKEYQQKENAMYAMQPFYYACVSNLIKISLY